MSPFFIEIQIFSKKSHYEKKGKNHDKTEFYSNSLIAYKYFL
nr:MAG TPA: hypothetical protein [Bacteriophage sp.]